MRFSKIFAFLVLTSMKTLVKLTVSSIFYLKKCTIYGIIKDSVWGKIWYFFHNFTWKTVWENSDNIKKEGEWKPILNKRIKYYAKETLKWGRYVAIALFIVLSILFIKYNLAFEVIVNGDINNKTFMENHIQELSNKEGTENIAFVDVSYVPEYKLTLISNETQLNDAEILAEIEDSTTITYKYYAVNLNGTQKAIVSSLTEAENLVSEITGLIPSTNKEVIPELCLIAFIYSYSFPLLG